MSRVKQPALLVVDLGTSSVKATLTDLALNILSVDSQPISGPLASSDRALEREFDASDFWKLISSVVARSVRRAKKNNLTIGAVGITSQRQGLAFIDQNGHELYIGPNLDLRAFFEGAAIDETRSAEVYAATGHLPSFLFAPAKLLFFKKHHTDLFKRISTVLTLGDWVAYKLTGALASCRQLANEAGLTELASQKWAIGLFDSLNLHQDFFPRLTDPGELSGYVASEPGLETGLTRGTPVTVAGADSQCALLGMNVIRPGEVGIVAGWSVTTQMITRTPIFDFQQRTWVGQSSTRGLWTLEANAGAAGNTYDWLRELLFANRPDGFSEMNRLGRSLPRGANGMLSHLGLSVSNLTNPGMRSGGFIFPVPFALTPPSHGDFVRAYLEEIAFSIRASCELLLEVAGQPITKLIVSGGMTKTPLFQEILSEVLGKQIAASITPQASSLGAAMLTGPLLPEFDQSGTSALKSDRGLEILSPDPIGVAEYDGFYSAWLGTGDQLSSLT